MNTFKLTLGLFAFFTRISCGKFLRWLASCLLPDDSEDSLDYYSYVPNSSFIRSPILSTSRPVLWSSYVPSTTSSYYSPLRSRVTSSSSTKSTYRPFLSKTTASAYSPTSSKSVSSSSYYSTVAQSIYNPTVLNSGYNSSKCSISPALSRSSYVSSSSRIASSSRLASSSTRSSMPRSVAVYGRRWI